MTTISLSAELSLLPVVPSGPVTDRISSSSASPQRILNVASAVAVSYVPAGTVSSIAWSSTVPGVPVHWLVGFAPGGIVPVQVTVVLVPAGGTVTAWEGGVEASVGTAASAMPTMAAGTTLRTVQRMRLPFRPLSLQL